MASLQRLEPTPVFDTFWRFAFERQNIFIMRLSGAESPFTDDEILRTYRFTNVYRATDRVSQFLIRQVIYNQERDPKDLLFRILLFKLFNSIETWRLLESQLGEITYDRFDIAIYDRLLSNARIAGSKIYSGAYIMPSGKSIFGSEVKHKNHLLLLRHIFEQTNISEITSYKKFEDLYSFLISLPTIGPFLGYQYAIDINYSSLTNFGESEFVVPGPGAFSGIHKCFNNVRKGQETEVIQLMYDAQDEEFEKRGLNFAYIGSRKLQYIDIQNIFCEVDKYARVAHTKIKGISNRTKIKQKFEPNFTPVDYFFPPKWNIKI